MSLATNAFVSLGDLRTYLSIQGDGQKAQLERALALASTLIETKLQRQIPTRGTLTEYHSLEHPSPCEIFLGEWPIVSVTSVHEDATRGYGAAALLVADTDYIVSKVSGKLIRVQSGAGAAAWLRGFRTVKVVYEAGYLRPGATTPVGAVAVPEDLALICLEVAAAVYQEADRKRWGVSAVSDSLGNVTRYVGYLTPDILARLMPYQRTELSRTWDRDAA